MTQRITGERVVKVTYWSCEKGHMHQTEDAAIRCDAKRPYIDPAPAARERRVQAARMLLKGSSYAEIGRAMGVSRMRARDVVWEAFRMSYQPSRVSALPRKYLKTLPTLDDFRNDSSFWSDELKKTAAEWGISE